MTLDNFLLVPPVYSQYLLLFCIGFVSYYLNKGNYHCYIITCMLLY